MSIIAIILWLESLELWLLFSCRINLSPFTKDFPGEEHSNESKLYFWKASS